MEYKSKLIDGKEVYFSADWINDLEEEQHFNWYWQQANHVYNHCSRSERILEIGLGTGLLSGLLTKRGWNIKTLDIDADKKPDFCTSAVDFDYADYDANTVLAFEIFEHVPFETFSKLIKKLGASKTKNIIFSLPWNEIEIFNLSFKLPKINKKSINITFEKGKVTTHAHFWELSKKDKDLGDKRLVTMTQLKDILESNGYSVRLLNKIGRIQYFTATKTSESQITASTASATK